MAIKAIPKDKLELLIKDLDERIISIEETAEMGSSQAICIALGMSMAVIEGTIAKLKGEYSI